MRVWKPEMNMDSLHPFDVTPPVEAAYATQDVSAITSDQSQIVSQSAPSFQFSPQSRTPTTTTKNQNLSLVSLLQRCMVLTFTKQHQQNYQVLP